MRPINRPGNQEADIKPRAHAAGIGLARNSSNPSGEVIQ